MYQEHRNFVKPSDPNVQIWRYLDFTKFVSLIDRKELFFIRADKLDDPFEGAITKINKRLREDFIKEHNLPAHLLSAFMPNVRKLVVINSWHMSDYESTAMWKTYLKSGEGVAIQTTFNNLTNSFALHVEDDIHIGLVRYTDYETEAIDEGNILEPFLHKRKSFEHEKELRAIIIRFPIVDKKIDFTKEVFDSGLYVKVDLDKLINKVYVSPYSGKWFYELVKSVANKYGLKVEIVESNLSQKPEF